MLIVVIIAYLYVLEYSDGIVGKGGQREVLRKKIGSYSELIESHQTGTEAGGYLTRNTTLVESYDTLVLFTCTNQDNLGSTYTTSCQELSFYLYLVTGNQGYATPQDDFRTEEVCGYRRYTTPRTFTLKGGNGTRMGDEEGRLLPYQ